MVIQLRPRAEPRYDKVSTIPVLLQRFAKKRACLSKGGVLDIDKASGFLLDDFRNGRIGQFTLEQVEQRVDKSENEKTVSE